jgi:lipoate-protein ligase A
MRIFISKTNEAYFNIASEEYLFNEMSDDILLFYVNSPSIIVGRKQLTMSEINSEYVKENQINVVRRLSGGGAVYHDLGNLNFCFITDKNKNINSDFSFYTKPIISFLESININAYLKGRNDLLIDGKKFSGNAKYFSNSRMLQHGTLLFKTNIENLVKALNSDENEFVSNAVKSIKNRVTNISQHLNMEMNFEDFKNKIIDFFCDYYKIDGIEFLSFDQIEKVNNLVKTKYNTWDWNYGTSPEYNFKKAIETPGGSIEAYIFVKNGIIKNINFLGDFFCIGDLEQFEKVFLNAKHNLNEMQKILLLNPAENCFININSMDILKILI